ncbi:LysR family transcriptional regulator [Burkholderia cenocepacia]|jgi:LysR family transcriptional regulator, benzoate and cis,cis-muconate-responsive activator of ben and cat genes|uniref:LysR family transcriptional regulator n=1 Tax=Burkholderia TaxID=32008 RepID=UPI00078E268C|nr:MULTISPECIES: LysR family transcriptional regulator [Burkholderia]AMU18529.1 LysR family transcriptional regulator [Burkholderia cenocepacia]MBG0874075.1 LysR family transcriptional regulator [Burkholderia sp. 9777_1386]MCW3588695.1 LysR family transcriptional regulator [Burkholderia cenocepacia]MCW3633686.1 LysR family transcriptional regulator [Burkholderia cenocepacia]MCW3648653.1 LysR family transcriptional regulator [Burkholderia cenocepacia]
MNLRQIRYFCAVVDAGSAALAAEVLFVAPTAISMQLAQLEAHLGGELFDRSRRPMELTSLGKYFYPRAKELLSHVGRLDDEARGIAAGKRGWLGVGFVRSTTFSVLPRAIRRFRESCPEVHLDLVEVLSEYQPEQLLQGRIDFGISRFIGPIDRHEGLSYSLICDESFVAVIPLDHSLAKQKAVTTAELSSLPFILYPKDPRSPFGHQMLSALQASGGRPLVGHEAIEINTALALVGAGLGATLVGRSIARNNRRDVKFMPVTDLDLTTTLVTITREGDENKLLTRFRNAFVSSG